MKKKVLAALLAVCMLASLMVVPASAAGFDDVADDHWAKEAIDRWAGFGVLNGKAEGKFDPDANMTRAQFAKFIVTLMGLPADSTEMPFEDVMGSADEWAARYIAAAHKAGIINGKSTTRFAPRDNVTFDQSAAMLARAVGLVEPSAYGEKVTEKLTELGMLDDNIKPDADPTRALVAGLTDKMIGKYVTGENSSETEDGVITGKVNGVILVVATDNGVAVEIKDVTTTAPIVAQGGNVTLTNTTAPSVVVAGGQANVEIDKDSSVDSVTVEGTNVNLTVDGTVKNVTVSKDATISHLEGEGVSSKNVTNNTGAEIEVNGEAVAPTPVKPENPDDNKGDDEQGEMTGFVPEPSKPVAPPTAEDAPAAAEPKVPAAGTGSVVDGEETTDELKATCAADGHKWNDKAAAISAGTPATCTDSGTAKYTCSVCHSTNTVEVPALGHNFYRKEVTAATCLAEGSITWACANSAECTKFAATNDAEATNVEKLAKLAHSQVSSPAVAATCTEGGKTAGIVCGTEGCTHVWTGCVATAALGHSWKKVTTTEGATSWVCTRDSKHTSATCPNESNHSTLLKGQTCSLCGFEGSDEGGNTPAPEHKLSYTQNDDATHNVTCSVEDCAENHAQENVACAYDQEGNKCVCGREKPADVNPGEEEADA